MSGINEDEREGSVYHGKSSGSGSLKQHNWEPATTYCKLYQKENVLSLLLFNVQRVSVPWTETKTVPRERSLATEGLGPKPTFTTSNPASQEHRGSSQIFQYFVLLKYDAVWPLRAYLVRRSILNLTQDFPRIHCRDLHTP